MLSASADYQAYEAQAIGSRPAVRATFLPYIWPNGINADGDFTLCSFISSGRIQANYYGFIGGEWVSDPLTANLQVTSSPAVVTFTWNYPGYEGLMYYRGGATLTALAAASWTLINSGDTIQIYPFYQFKLTLEGFRAWAVNTLADANGFTAKAVDSWPDAEQGYAAGSNVPGDSLAYVEDIAPLGEFTVTRDIEKAGSLTIEAPDAFDDLVAGQHSGLALNNRQGSFDGSLVWTPAPLFSPNKSSFFLSQQDWYDLKLKIELGWSKGGWFESGFLEDEWLSEGFTEFVTLFLGRVKQWGPATRALGEANNVEVYAVDLIADAMQRRICLPAADGSPTPLTFGEFLCKADAISGWSPAPVLKGAYFAADNYFELDHRVATGGGAVDLITPGLSGQTGDYAMQCSTDSNGQAAYGSFDLINKDELFLTGSMKFVTVPATPAASNVKFLDVVDSTGATYFQLICLADGNLTSGVGDSKFNVGAYTGVPVTFALWIKVGNPGYIKLWINGDEVGGEKYYNLASWTDMSEARFGVQTVAVPEAWVVVFDDVELRPNYYNNAYRVTGAPFTDIGPVYVDDVSQPDSKTVGAYTQTLARYSEYGIVAFASDDPEFEQSGEVMFRVIETAGGRHPLYIIEALLAEAGLTDYINAASLAAAYVAVPDDLINARFEGGESEKFGLRDIASLGLPVADALKEICSRCLYWIFSEAGEIKIVPYTGTSPGADIVDGEMDIDIFVELINGLPQSFEGEMPLMVAKILNASNINEATQTIDLENINAFVSATYGWYARNPSLYYVAGDQAAGGQGTGLDFTWDSPVAAEDLIMVKRKVDLLYKYLTAHEIIDPVTTTLAGARIELMSDAISLSDDLLNDTPDNYVISRKDVSLDRGERQTTLQLIRFLGDT